MKKIALNYIYLSPSHAGGKDQVGLNLLKGLYKLGYTKNMIIICFSYSISCVKTIAPDVQIIEIKGLAKKSELQRLLSIYYVNTMVIPKLILENNIGLIFHLSCNTGLIKLKTKTVVIPHDIKQVSHRILGNVKIPLYKHLLYKLLYYVDFKNNDYIISISDVDKNEIAKYYPKFARKIRRIYNPIDIKVEQDVVRREISDYIVALNLQFHHKNIITLIKAFDLIKDDVDVNLVLIGSVPERVRYLQEYVTEHNLQDRIIFTGFVSAEEKDTLFKRCRLYVNPTLYEGFGMTAVEAMIYRIPTLVSKIDTNYEITKGLCDYYYPPEDETELAAKITECLKKNYSDEKLLDTSNLIFNEYNYLKIAKEYINLFQKIIDNE